MSKPSEELKSRLKVDKIALAKILGYDFQPEPHDGLFETYLKFEPGKAYFDLNPAKDRLTLWPRGHFKTSSIVVEAVQTILNYPDCRILLMQSTVKNTKALLKEIKSHFNKTGRNSNLDQWFPEFCAEGLGNSESFTVPARQRMHLKEPTVMVASPKATKAGLHFDVAFFDDLVTEVNYKNPELMKQIIEDFSHYVPLIDPGGYRYVTGTRYTFGDLYEWIMRHGGTAWKTSLKAAYTRNPDGSRTILFPRKTLKDGRSIGFTLDMLDAIERENPETFSAQYMNNPIPAGRQLFPESLLLGAVRPKETNVPVGPAILFVDLASGLNADSDKSVVLCGRQVAGCPTVCDLRSGQWPTLQIAQNILELALAHRPMKVLVEGAAGSTYFIDYLRMIAKDKGVVLAVEPIKVSNNKGAKYLRIAAVEGAIKTGRLKFLAGLPGWAALVQQFAEFPRGRHDDEIDTVSMLVQFYSGQISNFEPMNTRLPFFLQRPGVDYGLEKKIAQASDDAEGLAFTPEPIF